MIKFKDFSFSIEGQILFIGTCALITLIGAIDDLILGNVRASLSSILISIWMILYIISLIRIQYLTIEKEVYMDITKKSIDLLNEIHDKIKEVDISPSDEAMKSTPAPEGVKANEPY